MYFTFFFTSSAADKIIDLNGLSHSFDWRLVPTAATLLYRSRRFCTNWVPAAVLPRKKSEACSGKALTSRSVVLICVFFFGPGGDSQKI